MDKKTFFLLLFAFFISITKLEAAPVSLAESRMFTASDVKVDVVDKDAATARKHAISNGQSLGLFKVLERIVDPKQFENLPEISDDEIADMVQDISVSGEKTSKVRYIANLDIRYKPESIRNFLKNISVSFVQSPAAPYLLLPLYYEKNDVFLWNDLNTWAIAWKEANAALIPLMLPPLDNTTASTINVNDVINFNPDMAKEWQKTYNTAGIIVAEVRNTGSSLKFKATKYKDGKAIETIQINNSYRKDLGTALKKIISEYITKTETAYRDNHVVNIADDTFITAVIPLETISDWLLVQKRLNQISTITKVELKAITKNKAQIELWFADGLPNLEKSLNGKNLKITPLPSDIYEITTNTKDTTEKEDDTEVKNASEIGEDEANDTTDTVTDEDSLAPEDSTTNDNNDSEDDTTQNEVNDD